MGFSVFVAGPLYNPMNGSHGTWHKRARWARQWRERTAQHLFVAQLKSQLLLRAKAEAPKQIAFELRTWNKVDDDALGPMAKPCRDALMDAGVIHSDAPDSGHVFRYSQVVNRAERGIRITVEVSTPPEELKAR